MPRKLPWILSLLLCFVAAMLGSLLARERAARAAAEAAAARDRQSLASAQKALEQANAGIETLRRQMTDAGIVPAPLPTRLPRPDITGRSALPQELARENPLTRSLESARMELEARVKELEGELDTARSAVQNGEQAAASLREALETAKKQAESWEQEKHQMTQRAEQAESLARRTQTDGQAAQQRASQAAAVVRELEEINRRRETALTNLQRRYRDVTDLLRSLGVRLENMRDNPAAAAPDISRIQQAVQSGEDDLRQLAALNAQAQRAAQRLPK